MHVRFSVLLLLPSLAVLWAGTPRHTQSLEEFNQSRFKGKQKIGWPICDDYTFLRRAYLDITGAIPDYETRERWFKTAQPWDREAIVDEALAGTDYTYRWTYFLEELLKSRQLNTVEPLMRESFHITLRNHVAQDMGWDQLTSQLITWQGDVIDETSLFNFWGVAVGEPLTWLDALDDQTGYITNKFLGIKTECISCHDGAYHLEDVNVDLAKRTREQFWGMAAFLSASAPYCAQGCYAVGEPIYQHFSYYSFDSGNHDPQYAHVYGEGEFTNGFYLAESETGEGMRPARDGGFVRAKYLFSGEEAPRNEPRREALARMLVNDRQFARNMVNRIWHHFFGQAFVEPLDGFDLARLNAQVARENGTTVQPSDPEMMEFMTDRFIEGNYRLKPLIREIVLSSVYQLDLEQLPDGLEKPYFGGKKRIRRVEAEGILESIYKLTGAQRELYIYGMEEYMAASAWDLADTSEPIFYPDLADVLDGLGRGDRANEIEAKTELDQTACLTLLNNNLLIRKLEEGHFLYNLYTAWNSGDITRTQMVRSVYQHTLLRPPSSEEMNQGLELFDRVGEYEGGRDLMWRLVNHMDFLFK